MPTDGHAVHPCMRVVEDGPEMKPDLVAQPAAGQGYFAPVPADPGFHPKVRELGLPGSRDLNGPRRGRCRGLFVHSVPELPDAVQTNAAIAHRPLHSTGASVS